MAVLFPTRETGVFMLVTSLSRRQSSNVKDGVNHHLVIGTIFNSYAF